MPPRSRAPESAPSEVPDRKGTSWLRRVVLPAALLVALTLAAFAPSLRAGFVWDDDAYITENPVLDDLAGLRAIWFDVGATKMYVPVVFTTFWIEHQLWGTRPLGYHATNLAFHAAGAILLWLLLLRLALPGAWLAAAIFAVHPIFVESVAWATELKNTLSTLFALLCLLAFLRARRPANSEPAGVAAVAGAAGNWQRNWYLLSLLAFAAALLSKPVVVALPFVLLLLLWWKRQAISRSDITVVATMVLLSVAAGLMAMHVEHFYGGARGEVWQVPLLDRALVAGRALCFYVAKICWPANLVPIYPRWKIDPRAAISYLYPLVAAATLAGLWLARRRIGRGPFTAAASFVLLVAPLIGFFNVSYHLNSFVADHFQHHAAPALIALFACSVATLAQRNPFVRRALPGLATVVVVLLVVQSNRYTRVFENEEARCRSTLEGNPDSWLAMNNLGVALNRRGEFAEATGWFEKAIRTRKPYPEAESNLGVALVGLGRPEAAIGHYREALRIWPDNPLAHNNLGTALAQTGQIEEATAAFVKALELRPDYLQARSNLEKLRASPAPRAETRLSIRELEEAVRQDPRSAEAQGRLGLAYAGEQRWVEAIQALEAATHLRPDLSRLRNDLGTALASSGNLQGAVEQFEAAVRLEPGDLDAQMNLGTALLSAELPARALAPLEAAVVLAPGKGQVHLLLGVALAQSGRIPEARSHFEAAVRLDPEDEEARANLDRANAVLAPP